MGIYDATKNMLKKKTTPQQATNPAIRPDDVWTRQYLMDKYAPMYGLKDSDIGFNNGSVTVKGIDAFKPTMLYDGKSYANPNMIDSAMSRVAIQGNLGIPEGYVRGRDYINTIGANYGINDNQIGWKTNPNTNMTDITVGGQVVGNGYINPAEGRTYVNQADLQKNLAQFAKNNGMQDIRQVEQDSVMKPDSFKSPFEDKINGLIDKILNPSKFEYNVESDPRFQALKGQYEKQGQSAYNNALGAMSAATGGRLNSWAASAAGQAQNAYNEKLMGLVPEMYQNAYNEYQTGINRDVNSLNSLMALDNNKYGRYRDSIGDSRNMRDYLLSKYTGDKTFAEGQKQFNTGVDQWNKNFDRSGTQWDKTFTSNEQQRGADNTYRDKAFAETVKQNSINNAQQDRQISISGSNSGLGWAEFNKKYDPNNPYYQVAQADAAIKLGQANNVMEGNNLGFLYNSMMSGKDDAGNPVTPKQWLQIYAPNTTPEQFKQLFNWAKSAGAFSESDEQDLASTIKEYGGK